jgi:hypothetical protein
VHALFRWSQSRLERVSRPNSLLTGKITGNFIFSHSHCSRATAVAACQFPPKFHDVKQRTIVSSEIQIANVNVLSSASLVNIRAFIRPRRIPQGTNSERDRSGWPLRQAARLFRKSTRGSEETCGGYRRMGKSARRAGLIRPPVRSARRGKPCAIGRPRKPYPRRLPARPGCYPGCGSGNAELHPKRRP